MESNDAALTPDDVQPLRLQTLADEHLMICLCGVDVERDSEAQVLEAAVLKIIRIKLQMGNHQISLAKAHGSQIAIVQEFTRNVETLVAAVPSLLRSEGEEDVVDLDSLLANTAHYFGALRDAGRSLSTSFRMLLVFRQVSQTPQLLGNQNEVSHPPAYQLDVIYWHRDVPMEAAQSAFDQLCAYDSTNPFSKFYFLEVGGSVERLHQVLVLALSHPAHRLGQNAAEQFLGSWLSPSK
ncbi:hypothetical protein PHYBOEH_008673 [Phytophthora boehmeriae]|uniref:Uncharacterized protein n=1 Tax=Phytophthora boehmeriae TaxID=109152 RepID=A0A8T1VYY8_9STRA|nr:hypothetical protein PHYBOEH_008673 [Phytophthora boehmeriae]